MSEGEHEPKRRQTRQGRLVHEAVSRFVHHPTAKEVHQALEGEGVGLATVYRQLARLVDDGMLGAVEHMGETRYDTNLDPHAHAVCNRLWGHLGRAASDHLAVHADTEASCHGRGRGPHLPRPLSCLRLNTARCGA